MEADVECNFAEYKEACGEYLKSKKKILIIVYILSAAMILIGTLQLLYTEETFSSVIFILVGVMYTPLLFFLRYMQLKTIYKHNTAMRDVNIHYVFTESGFEITTNKVNSKLTYDAMFKGVEGKKYILLQPSSMQFYMIKKENCSEELLAFLRMKMAEINAGSAKVTA